MLRNRRFISARAEYEINVTLLDSTVISLHVWAIYPFHDTKFSAYTLLRPSGYPLGDSCCLYYVVFSTTVQKLHVYLCKLVGSHASQLVILLAYDVHSVQERLCSAAFTVLMSSNQHAPLLLIRLRSPTPSTNTLLTVLRHR